MRKFTVHLSYHGCLTTEVEAENEQEALEKARHESATLSPDEFIKAIEPIEDGYDWEESKPEASKPKKLYQPVRHTDDGTNIEYGDMPEELSSFHAFLSRAACIIWLRDFGYDPDDFAILEYDEGDIEEPIIIEDW